MEDLFQPSMGLWNKTSTVGKKAGMCKAQVSDVLLLTLTLIQLPECYREQGSVIFLKSGFVVQPSVY